MIARVWLDRRARGKHRWCIIYRDWAGHKHREQTEATTRAEAHALLQAKLSAVAQDKARGGPLMTATFRTFVEEEFLPQSKAINTPRTYQTKRDRAGTLMAFFGDRRLRDITRGDIKKFIAERCVVISPKTKRPIRPATINRQTMCLSAIFREAWDREYVDRNPCRGVRLLPENNKRVRWLTDDEEKKLLGACAVHLRPIVLTAIHSGMRKGELLSLTWGDIDFDQRLVRVRAENSKTHKTRYIPMNDTLYATLKEIAPSSDAWGAALPVFAHSESDTQRKGPRRGVRTAFEAACRRADVTDLHFHDLRHTFASRLVQAGVALNRVGELLGHSTLQVTMRYAHLAPANLVDAVKLLDKAPEVEPAPSAKFRQAR
jgi:integrase